MSAEKAIEQINERLKTIDEEWKFNIGYIKANMSALLHQLGVKQDDQQEWEYWVTSVNRDVLPSTCNTLYRLYVEKKTLEKVLKALTEEDGE